MAVLTILRWFSQEKSQCYYLSNSYCVQILIYPFALQIIALPCLFVPLVRAVGYSYVLVCCSYINLAYSNVSVLYGSFGRAFGGAFGGGPPESTPGP